MRWVTAGRIIFWLTILVTLAWTVLGQPLFGTIFFFLGLAFTAEAFVAAKAEDIFPEGKHATKLGLLSCTLHAKSMEGAFDRIELKVDAKNRDMPFELIVHARKSVWKAKEKALKNKKAFAKIIGLVEADVQEKRATIWFEDEPNIKESIEKTLHVLKQIWR